MCMEMWCGNWSLDTAIQSGGRTPKESAVKRKLAWVCLLVSPLVLGGAVFYFLPRDPITQANCDKIKPGMTEKEVDAILGRRKTEILATGWQPRWGTSY